MIDTHSHIYSEEFDNDRNDVIDRAKQVGIEHIVLPNVDSSSLPRMLMTERENSGFCHAAIGLHPTSVGANYQAELDLVHSELERRKWIAIGEIGIDLYWDKTFMEEQEKVFRQQLDWALEFNLPVLIHMRNSFHEIMAIMTDYAGSGLRGIFHCFSGTLLEAEHLLTFNGFYLGIGGVLTFKNSNLPSVLPAVSLEKLVVETDAPYLTPVPHRGERNESSFVSFTVAKLAEIYGCSEKEIIAKTTQNAYNLFNFETFDTKKVLNFEKL